MNLQSHYRYIGLDFETTGLDVTKDEPIQIGIVELDHQGALVKEYSSYIKPTKDIKGLKDVVGYITGLSLDDLKEAPSVSQVSDEVSDFFDPEKTILIGHNIQFDIKFLEKFFPDLKIYDSIDTFHLAQTFVHFPPSYAQEVLVQYLREEKKEFKPILGGFDIQLTQDTDFANFHDALYDAKFSLALFVYFINRVVSLVEQYPILQNIMCKTDILLKNIIQCDWKLQIKGELSLPPLQKLGANNRSFVADEKTISIDELSSQKKYYVGDIPLKELITNLAVNKKVIFSFSNTAKLDIVKKMLVEAGVNNLGFAREEQVINYDNFKKLLNKDSFSSDETYFILKYLSHLSTGSGLLDLNRQSDFQIFNFLKEKRKLTKYPLVLCTHGGLFSMMEREDKFYQDYEICFFDLERWFNNYNFFASRPWDAYYVLNYIDALVYAYQLQVQFEGEKHQEALDVLQKFYTFFQTFIGVLSVETKKLFVGVDRPYIQHDPIVDHSDFYQTNLLLKQFQAHKDKLKKVLLEQDFQILREHMEHMLHVLNSLNTIQKKMYGISDFYFVYKEATAFTDRGDFQKFFDQQKVVYLSNHNKTYEHVTDLCHTEPAYRTDRLVEVCEKEVPNIHPSTGSGGQIKDSGGQQEEDTLLHIHNSDKVLEYLQTHFDPTKASSIFIVSTQKDQSRVFFEYFYRHTERGHHLFVENVTGNIRKILYKVKLQPAKIMIGGYNFLLQCYSNKVPIDNIIVFNIKGSLEKYILDDIRWYRN